MKLKWAIFSDKYSVWFPDEKHELYEKHPNTVTHSEFEKLKINFEERQEKFDEICFYHNPSRFSHLYKRLLNEVKISDRIRLFTH